MNKKSVKIAGILSVLISGLLITKKIVDNSKKKSLKKWIKENLKDVDWKNCGGM